MKDTDFNRRKKELSSLFTSDLVDEGISSTIEFIKQLFADKEYRKVVQLFDYGFIPDDGPFKIFEVAYSLAEIKDNDRAEVIYESILAEDPKNSSVLNNLSIIKKAKGRIEDAFDLIKRAYDITPNDEIISKNYQNQLSVIQEKRELESRYKSATSILPKENDFVIAKLKSFLINCKSDREFKNGQLPIPQWKFKVLMGTDEQKSLSLRDQWLEKSYIRKTDTKGEHGEGIYEINPYIETKLYSIERNKIPSKWINGFEYLSVDNLENLSYFSCINISNKVKRKYRDIIQRDIDELFLCYIMKNHKSVIILAGSMVELLLIYYCEKKHISEISYQKENRTIKRKLYDADLGDLLWFFEQQKMLGDITIQLGNISRMYRNFVHPGKELRETEILNQSKADLCFISAVEIFKSVCS